MGCSNSSNAGPPLQHKRTDSHRDFSGDARETNMSTISNLSVQGSETPDEASVTVKKRQGANKPRARDGPDQDSRGPADQVPASKELLFVIERSTNANVVVYDVRGSGGRPDGKAPIDVYWKMFAAKGGAREELNAIEKKMAYGYTTKSVEGDKVIVELKALKSRPATVAVNSQGQAQCFMQVNGKEAILKKVFVQAKSGWKVGVQYVDLYATDPATGTEVTERVTP